MIRYDTIRYDMIYDAINSNTWSFPRYEKNTVWNSLGSLHKWPLPCPQEVTLDSHCHHGKLCQGPLTSSSDCCCFRQNKNEAACWVCDWERKAPLFKASSPWQHPARGYISVSFFFSPLSGPEWLRQAKWTGRSSRDHFKRLKRKPYIKDPASWKRFHILKFSLGLYTLPHPGSKNDQGNLQWPDLLLRESSSWEQFDYSMSVLIPAESRVSVHPEIAGKVAQHMRR